VEGTVRADASVGPVIPLLEDAHPGVVVGTLVLMWLGWSLLVGWVAHRMSLDGLEPWRRRLRLRGWERGGRVYERIGVRRWKDALPEAGAWLPGGVSKRRIPPSRAGGVARLRIETVRAECSHWLGLVPIGWLFLLLPPAVAALNVVYALAANVPCIVVQRFNRGRLDRVLAPRLAAAGPAPELVPDIVSRSGRAVARPAGGGTPPTST